MNFLGILLICRFWLVGLGWDMKFYISNELPRDPAAAGPGSVVKWWTTILYFVLFPKPPHPLPYPDNEKMNQKSKFRNGEAMVKGLIDLESATADVNKFFKKEWMMNFRSYLDAIISWSLEWHECPGKCHLEVKSMWDKSCLKCARQR